MPALPPRTTNRAKRIALGLLASFALLAGTAYTVFAAGGKADFSLSASPSSQTVLQGKATTFAVSVTPTNGFAGTVSFGVTGLPSGVTGSYSPASSATGSTLTVSAAKTTPAGTYPLTISGTSGNLSHSTSATLVVRKGQTSGFTLSISPSSLTVLQGDNGAYTVTLTRNAGFTDPVALAVSGVPSGTTASFNPVTISGATSSSTLTVAAASNAATGLSSLTVTGTDTLDSTVPAATATATLSVQATASFAIRGNANQTKLSPGYSTGIDPLLSNPYGNFALSLTSLQVTLGSVTAPGTCSTQDFSVRQMDASALPVTIAASAQDVSLSKLLAAAHPTWTQAQVAAALPQVTMLNRPVNQDGCKSASVGFNYVGTAGK